LSGQILAWVLAAGAATGWLVVWRTAYRFRAPLLRIGAGQRIANYLLIAWRLAASVALVVALSGALELRSGRDDLGEALAALGLHLRLPAAELGVLSVLLFATCYAINLGFTFLRRALRRNPKLATVNMLPQTVWETVVFSLVLSPAAGIGEEVVYRGFLQWAISSATGDPVSAVGTQAVLFGMAHLYQGGLGVLRTFAIGVVFGAGTLASGSLIPAILGHTLLDIASGIVRVPSPTTAGTISR
jgi:membrane protease YdiL (CAAX protease family)